MEDWSDEKLIEGIRRGGRDREDAFHYIYVKARWRPRAIAVLIKMGANEEVAKEISHEAYIKLDEAIRKRAVVIEHSLEQYYMRITKNTFYNLNRARKSASSLSFMQEPDESINSAKTLSIEDEDISMEKLKKVMDEIKKMSKSCQIVFECLTLELSREKMAAILNLKNTNMVKKKIYRCRKALSERLRY